MEGRRNKTGKPKRRITPLRAEVDHPPTFPPPTAESSQTQSNLPTSKKNLAPTSTAGKVKIGIEVGLSEDFEVDWEELKRGHNYHEGKPRSSREEEEEDADGGTNLLAMLGKRAPTTRFVSRIMKRHERMFTVREREYYTRSSSGESSSDEDDDSSSHHSDSDGEAVEDGAENQGEDNTDERLDAGNYDFDDDFIDDSDVHDFIAGLLTRKPKFDGFCIVKGDVTVPIDDEENTKKTAAKPSRKRKAPSKPLLRQDSKKPSCSQTKAVEKVEPEPVVQQQALRQDSQEPTESVPQQQSLAELAVEAAMGSAREPDAADACSPPTSQPQTNPQPSRAKPVEYNPEDSLQAAVRMGANEAVLREHWARIPPKPKEQAVFLVLCNAGPEGLFSKEISEESYGIWPGTIQSEKRRGCITKFISTLSGGDSPVFRKEGYLYSLHCFPEVEKKKSRRRLSQPKPSSEESPQNQPQDAEVGANLNPGSNPSSHATIDNSQNGNSNQTTEKAQARGEVVENGAPSAMPSDQQHAGESSRRNLLNGSAKEGEESFVAPGNLSGFSETMPRVEELATGGIGNVKKQKNSVDSTCLSQDGLKGAV